MKKLITLSIFILLTSCAKNPEDFKSISIFDVSIDGKNENITMKADPTLQYKINFKSKDNLIKDGAQIEFNVSNGLLYTVSKPKATKQNIEIYSGEAELFYEPDSKQTSSGLLEIQVGNYRKQLQFTLIPSEPESVFMTASQFNPTSGDDVTITSTFTKSNGRVSDNLQINYYSFAEPLNDSTKTLINPISKTKYNPDTDEVSCTSILKNISGKTGTTFVVCEYTHLNISDTIKIEYQ